MNYGMVQVNFQVCSFNFTRFVSHDLTSSELCCDHIKRHNLDAARTWYIQHEFSDCRKKGAAKFKSKKFSEFGSKNVT